jgi:hypothetical protein
MREDLATLLRSDASSTELSDWALSELRRGAKPAAVARALEEAGWAPQLAAYFTQRLERVCQGDLRRKAALIAGTGAMWMAVGIGGIFVGHELGGTWSTHGPLVVGWGVVACGAMRLIGGAARALSIGRAKRASGAMKHALAMGWNDQPAAARTDLLQPTPSAAADLRLLGLPPGATLETAHRAFKAHAKMWHPDRFDAASELRPHAEKRMKLFNAAYARVRERLSD